MQDKGLPTANLTQFMVAFIRDYVRHSSENRLPLPEGGMILDEPLLGSVNGDDPIFLRYKQEIGGIVRWLTGQLDKLGVEIHLDAGARLYRSVECQEAGLWTQREQS